MVSKTDTFKLQDKTVKQKIQPHKNPVKLKTTIGMEDRKYFNVAKNLQH